MQSYVTVNLSHTVYLIVGRTIKLALKLGRERLVISHCGSHNKNCIKSGSQTEKGWEALP